MNKNFRFPFINHEVEQAVQDFIKAWNVENTKDFGWSWTRPLANIEETDNQFQIFIAAPGLVKSDFKLTLEKDVLTVAVDKAKPDTAAQKKATEFSYYKFSRSFKISQEVNAQAISATYENGILTLTLPKKEEAISGPKTITIN